VSANDRVDVKAVLADKGLAERALNQAVREALDRHKRLGLSIAVWRDGQVVIVPPEEIEVEPQAGP
jgi:hypothetical protein